MVVHTVTPEGMMGKKPLSEAHGAMKVLRPSSPPGWSGRREELSEGGDVGHVCHKQALNSAHEPCLGLGPGTAPVWKGLPMWR